MMIKRFFFYFFLLFFVSFCFGQLPSIKNPDYAVQDYVGILSEQESQFLNQKLYRHFEETSTRIVIAILPKVEDDINFQAAELLAKWKIGEKGKDNGVLILLAYEQRKVAISTAYGVEEYLTDALSKQIISQDMIPSFKMGNYYQGLNKATTSIIEVLSGKFKREPKSEEFSIFPFLIILIFVVIFMYFASKNRRNGGDGNHKGGSDFDLFDMIILSNMGRSSGNFGGFGRSSGGGFGGFGGFGGGMGGGGGASGSW